jgi:pyruvate-formate lyase-activating enzyme
MIAEAPDCCANAGEHIGVRALVDPDFDLQVLAGMVEGVSMNSFSEIKEPVAMEPEGRIFKGGDQRAPLMAALTRWGQAGPGQTAGRFYPIACVALEITQRCNLDCTLCYLSHAAEMAHDVPLDVLFSRIDMIESHYGPGTSIQITGGDPTLRKPEDLEVLCRYIRARNMRTCLMTNGVKASRELLRRLGEAGLDDVAFHVDITQERQGFSTEVSLNAVRRDYIARAKGLGLRIFFNTTIFDGNIREVPALVRFFREHAADITLTSFQLQADTGRGVLRGRDGTATPDSVMAALSAGMDASLDFDIAAIGHAGCARYCSVLVAGDQAVSALSNHALFEDLLAALADAEHRVDAYLDIWLTGRRVALRRPLLALRALRHGLWLIWRLRSGLWSSRGRVHRMAVMIHNFMDSERLERDRCESCVFMVATEEGPLSMCVHNARRDHHIFVPAKIETPDGLLWWSAATGQRTAAPDRGTPGEVPFKRQKGRMRAASCVARSRQNNK